MRALIERWGKKIRDANIQKLSKSYQASLYSQKTNAWVSRIVCSTEIPCTMEASPQHAMMYFAIKMLSKAVP